MAGVIFRSEVAAGALAATLAAPLLLAGCERPAAPSAARTAARIGPCRTADLALAPASPKAAASMGPKALTLRMINRGRNACHLKGYAQVALLGPGGVRLEPAIERGPLSQDGRQGKVVLRPGRAANFAILFGDGRDGPCQGFERVAVSPPDDPRALTLSAPGRYCRQAIVLTPYWYDSSETL